MTSLSKIKEYLVKAILLFQKDPADSDYQRGYEAALQDMYDFHFCERLTDGV